MTENYLLLQSQTVETHMIKILRVHRNMPEGLSPGLSNKFHVSHFGFFFNLSMYTCVIIEVIKSWV